MTSAVCGLLVRGDETVEDDDENVEVEEEEHVEMTIWDTVTNYFQANEEDT